MDKVMASLALPLIMIVVGFMMKSGWPKKPNWIAGHRTSMSKKNLETWNYAHKYGGKFDVAFGFIAIIPSAIVGILVDTGTLQIWALGALVAAQFFVVILGIIRTEIALRKEFDENGERRRQN